jgi:acetolactate synthase-1/2/3 large subunit
MGGMGYAIPAAVGASMNDGEFRRTMVICGDGAFLMQGMEVHTAVEQELPILFVVFNNAKHGMCVTRQQVYFDGRIECASYAEPSIAQISRGFGASDALWVGRAGTLVELDAAFDALSCWDWAGPAVLELTLRREEVPPFAPFLPADAPQGHSRAALVNS